MMKWLFELPKSINTRLLLCIALEKTNNDDKEQEHPAPVNERGAGVCLADFFYFAGAYAARTHMQAHMAAMLPRGFYALYIRFGRFFRSVIGMAHLVAAELSLAAYITFNRHAVILRKLKIIA